MNKQTITLAVAGAIVGVVVVGSAGPSWAAPVSSSRTAFKQVTLSNVTDVRHRRYYGRRYYNPGAAIGSGYYGPGYGYYGPGYRPGYGYYGNPYPYGGGYYYPY